MLEVVYYQSNEDLFDKIDISKSLIIAPSPLIADNLRSVSPEANVLTISKWSSDQLSKTKKQRIRKSELMLRLSAVWKHYFPEGKAQTFREDFELFTELRAFTLNLELLAEFFKELSAETVRAMLIFWTYVDQENLIDEHKSYFETSQVDQERDLVFIGFKHLSGVQIDMLKKLSEQVTVQVSFPHMVLNDVQTYDWINWLDNNPPTEIKSFKNCKLSTVLLPKGKANKVIQEHLRNKNKEIVFATKTAEFLNVQEVFNGNSFFKTSEDLFYSARKNLFSKLSGLKLNQEELKTKLDEFSIEAMKSGDYRLLKTIQLLISKYTLYAEVSDSFDSFAFDILEEIVALDSPRSSFVSLEKNHSNQIADVNGLSFNQIENLCLVVREGLGSLKSGEKILSEAMAKALRAIGPIKRSGLDYLFVKNDIINALSRPHSSLLIEESFLHSDLVWRDILKHFDLDFGEGLYESSLHKAKDHFSHKMKKGPFPFSHYSASSLQSYMDCPRKFYYSFIESLEHRPDISMSMGADELGKIEHAVIEKYFKENPLLGEEINLVSHYTICESLFQARLTEGHYDLSASDKAKYFNEVLHFSLNGLLFLKEFCADNKAISINFEIPFKVDDLKIKGSIDCLIEMPDGSQALFDFKRSSAAVGSKTDFLNLRKIQLWIYLVALNNANKNISAFGYINLSDLNDQNVIFQGTKASDLITSQINSSKDTILKFVTEAQTCTTFNAKPVDDKACRYCAIQLYCHKGVEI